MRKESSAVLAGVYYKHAETLYQYGLKITKDTACIEDAIQELFLSFLRNNTNLNTTNNTLFYLISSFRHQLLKELNRKNRSINLEACNEEMFSVTFNIEAEMSQKIISDNKRKLIIDLMNSLSERQKESIYLKYKNGLSNEEIASVMNISNQACRNLICKSIKRMREYLSDRKISSHSISLFLIVTTGVPSV